eukprot:6189615-Pleurochrysis_carterae.AAC.3
MVRRADGRAEMRILLRASGRHEHKKQQLMSVEQPIEQQGKVDFLGSVSPEDPFTRVGIHPVEGKVLFSYTGLFVAY